MIKKDIKNHKMLLVYIIRLLRLCWLKERKCIIVLISTIIIQSLIPFLTLLSVQKILNTLQMGEFENTYFFLIAYLICMIMALITKNVYNYNENAFRINLSYDIKCLITEKSNSLNLIDYENSETYDKLVRALKEADAPNRIMNILMAFFSKLLGVFGSVILLVGWNWKIIFFILVIPIFSLIYSLKLGKYEFGVMQKRSTESRKVQYLSFLLNNQKSYKENKALNIDEDLFESYKDKYKNFVSKDKEILKMRIRYNTFFGFVEKISGGIVIAFIIMSAIEGKILIGEVNTYIRCIWKVTNDIEGVMSAISKTYSSSLYLKNLFDFLDYNIDRKNLENRIEENVTINEIDTIEFKDVSFRYREDLEYTLNNINIKIDKSDNIALIGNNGSGKSTFIKLLSGFYENYEGEILINGISLKRINKKSYLKKLGITFQDFTKYEFTLEENLKFGIDKRNQIGFENKLNKLNRYDILSFIKKHKQGLNTQLGHRFDNGVELSGGEWQQISLARAIMKDADVYILDEPSASLDIKIESKMVEIINKELKEKVCLLITHRLNNVNKFANRIVIFDKGRIMEDDDIEKLMSMDSYYKKIYNSFKSGEITNNDTNKLEEICVS